MRAIIKYLCPIILIEIYLIFTLLIFSFGPVDYYLDNPLAFWFYISIYHISMIFGYVVAAVPFNNMSEHGGRAFADISSLKIRLLIFVAFLAFLIGHKNITMSDSIIPVNFISDVKNGLLSGEEQYVLKIERLEEYSGSKILNVLNFFVAFSKIVLIPVIVFYWEKLSVTDKIFALLMSFLPVLSGISTGTNKPLFDFVIIYGSSLLVYFSASFYRDGRWNFKSRRFFLMAIFVSLVVALWFFGVAMLGRGGDTSYFETTSPLGHIKVSHAYQHAGEDSFLSYVYVWLSNYLVQGYYGFSQSLNADFTSTFGFGNSQFLMRQFEWVTGYDLSQYTYQHKIDAVWGETAQWHSLYSHIANDFHFFGVAVWLFVIGFYFSKLWKSLLDDNNMYAKFLLPLFGVLFVFMPANNQVFGFLETFSAFFFMSLLWFRSVYGRRAFLRG